MSIVPLLGKQRQKDEVKIVLMLRPGEEETLEHRANSYYLVKAECLNPFEIKAIIT